MAVAALLALPAPSLAQTAEVTGARLTIVERPESSFSVTLSNLRDVPLVAWELGLFRPGRTRDEGISFSDYSYYSSATNYAPGDGPLAPGKVRTVSVPGWAADNGRTVLVTFALFADGRYEGRTASAEAFREKRRREADDLRWWVKAMAGMPAAGDTALQNFIRELLAQRAADVTAGASTFASNLRGYVNHTDVRFPGWLRNSVNHLLTGARQRLITFERPIEADLEHPETVASVGIRSTPITTVLAYGLLENRRDSPLESWKIRWSNAGGRTGGAIETDACGFEGVRSGPIQPGEVREFLLWRNSDVAVETVKLEFLLFADLTWEGSQGERDEVLKTREQRAVNASHWAPILAEAALMAPEKGVAFLEAAKREREVATAAAPPLAAFQPEIDEVIRRGKRNPDSFAPAAREFLWKLERFRVLATRHVKQP